MRRRIDNEICNDCKLALLLRFNSSKLIVKLLFIAFIAVIQYLLNFNPASAQTIIPSSINLIVVSSSEANAINNSNINGIPSPEGISTITGKEKTITAIDTNKITKVTGTISDLSGKKIYNITFIADIDNGLDIKLNPRYKLAKGMYFVTLIIRGQKITKKLVVE